VEFGNRWLLACAVACILAPVEFCRAGDTPLPAETSFAYFVSHSVKPLPDPAASRPADTGGRDSNAAIAFDASHETPIDVKAGAPRPMSRSSVCRAVASVARANDLPVPFFANLIWQESGFNSRVVSPAGAQGIAQFMPETAKEYGLTNPFDPIHALNAAGRFLNKLVGQFGNLGLAAAAYNAGPARVNDFMTKRRQLPDETKNYVVRITGRPAEKWTSRAFVQAPEAKLMPAKAPCVEVAEEVAAQVKAVQSARLAALAAAVAARRAVVVASMPRTGGRVHSLDTARIALVQTKGKTLGAMTANRSAAAPIKIADRIVSEKIADRTSRAVPQKPGRIAVTRTVVIKTVVAKTIVPKTAIAKIAQKTAPRFQTRTRVASAR
jgi:hypothetical protein